MNSFIKTINSINRGNTAQQASEELDHLVESIMAHGAKGTLTLKLEITPSKELNHGVMVKATISSSAPKPNNSSLLYVNQEGDLVLRDPNQPDLDGFEVIEGSGKVKEVESEAKVKEVG